MHTPLFVQPEDVVLVTMMPCVAKKSEAERPEMESDGVRHVDYVLTTRELGRMLRHQRIPLMSLKSEQFDDPLAMGSGAGQLFGNTGGL